MPINMKTLPRFYKIAITILGVFGVGLAMAMMHFSNVGADPVTVLISGLADVLHLSEGVAATLLNAGFLLFLLFFYRRVIRIATLISVLAMGPFMDLSLLFLRAVFPHLSFLTACLLMGMGALLLGCSIGLYLSLDFGSSPADGMMLWFHWLLKIRYQYCTWLFYACCLVAGWLLGGKVTVGTFFTLFVVGIACDRTLHWLERTTSIK